MVYINWTLNIPTCVPIFKKMWISSHDFSFLEMHHLQSPWRYSPNPSEANLFCALLRCMCIKRLAVPDSVSSQEVNYSWLVWLISSRDRFPYNFLPSGSQLRTSVDYIGGDFHQENQILYKGVLHMDAQAWQVFSWYFIISAVCMQYPHAPTLPGPDQHGE